MNENVSENSAEQIDDWSDFDFGAAKTKKVRPIFAKKEIISAPKTRKIWHFAAVGIVAGIVSWLLTLALNSWIIRPVFCQNVDVAAICASSNATAFYISLAVIGFISFAYFAKKSFPRAFLTALVTFVSLAALWPFLGGEMIFSLIILAIFGALFYEFFAKISGAKSYVFAFILDAIFVALIWIFVGI